MVNLGMEPSSFISVVREDDNVIVFDIYWPDGEVKIDKGELTDEGFVLKKADFGDDGLLCNLIPDEGEPFSLRLVLPYVGFSLIDADENAVSGDISVTPDTIDLYSYTFVGTLTLSAGITNPRSLKAYLVVNVVSDEIPEDTYQLTVIGGSGSGRYAPGTSVTVTANAPATGKVFDGWTAVGVTLADPSASTVTFTMPAGNVTLTAKWRSSGSSGGGESGGTGGAESGETYRVILPVYTVNGTVTADPTEAAKGGKVTLTVTPANGYALDALMVLDADGNALALSKLGGGKFTFTMPGSDVTVKAVFAQGDSIFTDVPAGSVYEDAIQWAVKNGITNGYGNGLFGTNDPCTRAQIVTFLWRAAGCPQPKMTLNPFRDVAADAYYYKAVLWAVENGITSGLGDGRFAPEATCTRGQSVTFLYRAAGSPASGGSSFADVPAGAYCASAVAWAVENGITTGTAEGKFSPDATCTRAQAVTFLARAQNATATGKTAFSDVPADSYFADAVAWAQANGVTTGTSDTTFSPDSDCTRAQIVTFLYRANQGT